MEGILTTFGIDWKLIIVQIFNFAILVAVLGYFLYTPILRLLKEREEKIAQGINDARQAREAKDQAGKEKQDILTTAHEEASEVAKRAKSYAEEKGREILLSADAKANILLQEAEEKSRLIRERARKESQDEVAKSAVLMAEEILRERQS